MPFMWHFSASQPVQIKRLKVAILTRRRTGVLALVLALSMVLGMVPALAAGDTSVGPTTGSITINSPVVGATYKLYKIFKMTTNNAEDAFAYTIDTESPFYGAVVGYYNINDSGLNLTRVIGSNPAEYNVTVDESKFDAQTFGKAMQAVLANGSPAVTADAAYTKDNKTGIAPKAAGGAAITITEALTKNATITDDNTSDQLKFEGIDLGYYLINPTYPSAAAINVTMGEGTGVQTFTVSDLEVDGEGKLVKPYALTTVADSKVDAYVNATVDDDYVNDYITANRISTNKDGSPLNDAGKAEYKDDLKASMKADAIAKIIDKLTNLANDPGKADINVKEPILVFVDSAKPDAVINEKNELDKWDVPVNPTGEAKPGTPDHGEPKGGKNLVVGETTDGKPIYGDWTEANIGESVHYQLRVNAMNFIRTGEKDDTVQQVKEYFLADYQSAQMHFDASKGLHVSIWQGDNGNDSQATTAKNVTSNVGVGDNGVKYVTYQANNGDPYLDYTYFAQGDVPNTFFKNGSNKDGENLTDIFGEGTGIVVPWVIVSEEDLSTTYPIYTTTNIPKVNAEGQPVYKTEARKNEGTDIAPVYVPVKALNSEGKWEAVANQFVSVNNHIVDAEGKLYDTDANGNLKKDTEGNYVFVQDTKPVYTYSIYNSDVTILVDYWMILDDDAIVDEPGNVNYAQYAWTPVDNTDTEGNPKTPTNPKDEDKPSQKEEIDEATVYTYAIAWVKVDEQANELAHAKFELPFYVKVPTAKDGNSYVYAMSLNEYNASTEADKATKYTKELETTTESAVITIKGLKADVYTITETKAPDGYNKLAEPFTLEAKKSGVGVTTKTKTVIYLDANGNITETVTTATVEYETDTDSFNNASQTGDEEKSVPVYQYKYIKNTQGVELPSTGGIGTTIFYVVGSILVLAAAILLITKRRMGAGE